MKQTFISELIQRVKKENPKFFKRLQTIALVVGGISAALAYFVSHGTGMPEWLVTLSKELVTICASTFFVSLLPNTDPETQNKNQIQ